MFMRVKLETFLREITEKTTVNNQYPVLTSSKSGLYFQSDYFNKQVASKDNTGYKIIRKGQFTYRAMSDTGEFFPNMLECAEIGIVSPAYPVFEIVDTSLIVPEYLKYFFKSDVFQYSIASFVQGSTRTSVKFGKLKTISMELPDKEKQNQIIEILNATERIIERRKEELQQLDELVKARFVEMFGGIHDERFELKSLPEIVVKGKNSIKRGPFGGALKKEDFVETGYLVYEQRHAIHNDFEYEKYYITKEKYEDMIGFMVVPGDLIISCSGVTLGRIAEVPKGAKEGIINQALLKLSLNQTVMKNTFFIHQFRSREIQEVLFGFSRGSGIPNMPSMSEVKAVKFICPPIELQEEFVTFVEQIDKSKFVVQKALDEAQTLFDSLMQEYFG